MIKTLLAENDQYVPNDTYLAVSALILVTLPFTHLLANFGSAPITYKGTKLQNVKHRWAFLTQCFSDFQCFHLFLHVLTFTSALIEDMPAQNEKETS